MILGRGEAEIKGSDILVVGGGLVGSALAREAACRGARVSLLERSAPGAEASWAAAGMLSPLAEGNGPGAFLDLALASLALYPAFVEALNEETGLDAGFLRTGKLLLAWSPDDEAALAHRHAWLGAAGLASRWVDRAELLQMEPALSPSVTAGLSLPDEAMVDNRVLARAAWNAAARSGARCETGWNVERIVVDRGRAAGVGLRGGGVLEADRVVVAAGAWSGQLAGLPRPLPVRPVHGQMVSLECTDASISRIVSGAGTYLLPRTGGGTARVWVGATVEEAGWAKRTTAAARTTLHEGAASLVPALEDARVLEHWSGLRPGTPDALPVLGPDPHVEGLFYATGHFRNGILLAPITARLLAFALDGERASELHPFRIERFDSEPHPSPTGTSR